MRPGLHMRVVLWVGAEVPVAQAFNFCGNRPPPPTERTSSKLLRKLHHVPAAMQSYFSDCGCHALMNLRHLASVNVLHESASWAELCLPAGTAAARDTEWREQLADELVLGECDLCRFETVSGT